MLNFFRDVYLVLSGRDEMGDKVVLSSVSTEDVRAAAARFSRGNIAIQEGAFVTGSDLDGERAKFARHLLK